LQDTVNSFLAEGVPEFPREHKLNRLDAKVNWSFVIGHLSFARPFRIGDTNDQ
jgi:hypothetical protein